MPHAFTTGVASDSTPDGADSNASDSGKRHSYVNWQPPTFQSGDTQARGDDGYMSVGDVKRPPADASTNRTTSQRAAKPNADAGYMSVGDVKRPPTDADTNANTNTDSGYLSVSDVKRPPRASPQHEVTGTTHGKQSASNKTVTSRRGDDDDAGGYMSIADVRKPSSRPPSRGGDVGSSDTQDVRVRARNSVCVCVCV